MRVSKDKKVSAALKETRVLKTEIRTRLKEAN